MTDRGIGMNGYDGNSPEAAPPAGNELDRRAFLAACLRYPVVAVLIRGGGVRYNPHHRAAREGQCPPARLCDQCPQLGGCKLPSAQAHRRRAKDTPS
jgi:hypothetical protein